jgi:hypothetical protein
MNFYTKNGKTIIMQHFFKNKSVNMFNYFKIKKLLQWIFLIFITQIWDKLKKILKLQPQKNFQLNLKYIIQYFR